MWRIHKTIHDDVIKWKHFPRYWTFVRGIHRWPVNSPHEWPVTRKMFPFDDVIMQYGGPKLPYTVKSVFREWYVYSAGIIFIPWDILLSRQLYFIIQRVIIYDTNYILPRLFYLLLRVICSFPQVIHYRQKFGISGKHSGSVTLSC